MWRLGQGPLQETKQPRAAHAHVGLHTGKVECRNHDGTYHVVFLDDDYDKTVKPSHISLNVLKRGDAVNARWNGSVRFYPGKVHACNPHNTYYVKFLDGDEDKSVKDTDIKPRLSDT